MPESTFVCLSGQEAADLLQRETGVFVFDVRDRQSYLAGHVDGAAQLSEDRLLAWMKRIPKTAPVLIYCYHGHASQTYAQMFVDFRYQRVFSVDGGFSALQMALTAAGVQP